MSDGQHCLRCARNAWQKLGNMNPDVAMEQYIALLSDRIPGWREESSAAKSKKHSTEAEISVVPAPKSRSFAGNQTTLAHGRGSISETKFDVDEGDLTGASSSDNMAKE